MTATFVPSSWPAARRAPRAAAEAGPGAGRAAPPGLAQRAGRAGGEGAKALRFGREVALTEARGSTRALRWQLRRHRAITPRRMLTAYAGVCTLSLAVALVLWFTGARAVLAFTGFELMLLGAAMLLFARHAGDRETLTLVGRSLLVERSVAERVERAAFNADWLTVEPAAGQNSLVELAGQGHTMRVGRFLRPELRSEFARELRRALRQASDIHNEAALPRRAGPGQP